MPLTLDGTNGVSAVQAGAVEKDDLFSGFANGITEADQWRLTTVISLVNTGPTDINSSWERVDEPASNYIGTGMSESSGIFTFPSTGIWKVEAVGRFFDTSAYEYASIAIFISSDGGSTYDQATEHYQGGSANHFGSAYSSILVNVTDISLQKIKFVGKSEQNGLFLTGNSNENQTHVTFTKLGGN